MNPNESLTAIDEIREIRHTISARFGHDPQRLVDYYMALQKQRAEGGFSGSTDQEPTNQLAQ